jgi:hypothetical protein
VYIYNGLLQAVPPGQELYNENNVVSQPDVEKINGLITALSEHAAKNAREQRT